MDRQAMKREICAAIDARRDQIIAIGEDLFRHPELGYREFYTADVVKRTFGELDLTYRSEIGITGVRAEMKGRESKVKLAVMGELDAILCANHPLADPRTGAAHSCGHNAQIAGILGVAMALRDTGLMDRLSGDIAFLAVPAEEYVELEYRNQLRSEGKIRFIGGKQEFIARGEFDDIDLAMMFHSNGGEKKIRLGSTSYGFIGKLIRYRAKMADAKDAGANALNAAMLGVMGIQAQRQSFKDAEHVRVHPMITTGCNPVNIIAAGVQMETYVRGATIEAIIDASKKVDRALRAGADAVGAELEITQVPGYLPRRNDPTLVNIFTENAVALVGTAAVDHSPTISGSSDIGDLSMLMPTVHPYVGGVTGYCHTSDFMIVDEEFAYINATKLLAMSLIDLLANGAALALLAKSKFQPLYGKASYLQMWHDLCQNA